MEGYKVTVERVTERKDGKEGDFSNPRFKEETVYEQRVEKLDILAVIRAVNGVEPFVVE